MHTLPLLPLIAVLLLVLAIRHIRRRTQSRGRPRRTRILWTFSYRVLPVPQCSLQTDDVDFIDWLTSRLSGIDAADPSLPLTRPGPRSNDKRTTSGKAYKLRELAYNYVSPILALVGSGLALALLLYQAGWTVRAIAGRIQDVVGDRVVASGEALMKRGFEVADGTASMLEPVISSEDVSTTTDGSVLQPLIPGITIPLSHTFPLLLALFASQIIHELGHLIVAALHDIPTSRLVAGIWLVFPFAAVVLPSTINHAKPKTLLRVAAGGPFHNLVTWLLVLSLPLLRLGGLFYEDVGREGAYVVDVHKQSPLTGHLPEHVLIVRLADVPLGTAHHLNERDVLSEDIWTRYLLPGGTAHANNSELERWNEGRGWCVDELAVRDSPSPPCPPSTGIRFTLVELPPMSQLTHNETRHHCFSAYPLLTEPTVDCTTECVSDDLAYKTCIKPIEAEEILRIRFVPLEGQQSVNGREERVVLFAGKREAVYRDVQVSNWRPRGGMVGRVVIRWMELLLLYIATLSLALATLNLLPLPHLDGTHILTALLGLLIDDPSEEGEEDFDVDDEGEAGAESHNARRVLGHRRRWHRVVSWTTMAVAAVCVGGGIVLQALS